MCSKRMRTRPGARRTSCTMVRASSWEARRPVSSIVWSPSSKLHPNSSATSAAAWARRGMERIGTGVSYRRAYRLAGPVPPLRVLVPFESSLLLPRGQACMSGVGVRSCISLSQSTRRKLPGGWTLSVEFHLVGQLSITTDRSLPSAASLRTTFCNQHKTVCEVRRAPNAICSAAKMQGHAHMS
eukprot:6208642-Pleurochrysis_carterae.AAC.5